MAIDYGAMQALTLALNGTSEARRARKQEEAQMRQEIMQQEQLDFQNAKMIGAERDALAKLEKEYMTQVNNIPHMRDYMTNYFDEKKMEFKSILKTFNGRYSSAMSSGKVLDLRDSIVSGLTNSEKYQNGVTSAKQLALLDQRSQNKDTSDLISQVDLENRRKYLAGETDSFKLSGLRARYDAVDTANYYEGQSIDFDEVFNSQYLNIVHNYALEKQDPQLKKLEAEASVKFPGDPYGKEKLLKSFAKTDMGMKGAYNPDAVGTKEMGPVEMEAEIRAGMQKSYKGRTSASKALKKVSQNSGFQAFGVRPEGPDQVGKVKIEGYRIFTDATDAPQKAIEKLLGTKIKNNSDGTYDMTHSKSMYDQDGVYIDGYEAKEDYEDMRYDGAYLVNKAIFNVDGEEVHHIIGDSTDKDLMASLKEFYKGDPLFVSTMVGVYQNDDDDQVMIELNPGSVSLERIIENTGQEANIQKSSKSSIELEKSLEKKTAENEAYLNQIRKYQQKEGNAFYKDTDFDMDGVDYILGEVYKNTDFDNNSKGIIYSLASSAAKNQGGDFRVTSQRYLDAMNNLLKDRSPKGKEFQKAIATNNPETIFDVMNKMFNGLGDKGEILKLAEIWDTYN